MNYISVDLRDEIVIKKIYTIHYFEYMNTFSFAGETHNFWEFICVDKGEVNIFMGEKNITLKKGEVAFHKPNEFHRVIANGKSAPNLVVISFYCDSSAMNFFEDQILKVNDMERDLLAKIISEAKQVFSCKLDDPYLTKMTKCDLIPFGSEQLIRLNLEYFLIHLIRRYRNRGISPQTVAPSLSKAATLKGESEVFNRIHNYMELHLDSRITIEQLCKDNMIGRSQLQKIFQRETGLGIIEYFSKMKIEAAKYMIRTGCMNFTQISEQLGYTSIHYFSRQFKKITGMTPSEYASSIKAIAESNFKDS